MWEPTFTTIMLHFELWTCQQNQIFIQTGNSSHTKAVDYKSMNILLCPYNVMLYIITTP